MCSSSDLLRHFSAFLCIPSPGHLGFNYFLYKWTCIFLKIRSWITIWRQSKNIRVAVVHTGSRLIAVRILRGIGASNIIDSKDILIPRISFQTTLHLAGHPSQTVPFMQRLSIAVNLGLTHTWQHKYWPYTSYLLTWSIVYGSLQHQAQISCMYPSSFWWNNHYKCNLWWTPHLIYIRSRWLHYTSNSTRWAHETGAKRRCALYRR